MYNIRLNSDLIRFKVILSVLLCVLGLFEDGTKLEVPQYVLYTVVRGFLYAYHSAYIGVAFPSQHFATLLGVGFLCQGVIALTNYGLFELTTSVFGGSFFYTNVVLLVLVTCSFLHPLNVWIKVK